MNTDTKHTPGPWKLETVKTSIGSCHKIGAFPAQGARSETYACVYADNIDVGQEKYSKVGTELLANAHLIAAAPDMYEALKELLEISSQFISDKSGNGAALRRSRAALSKATP